MRICEQKERKYINLRIIKKSTVGNLISGCGLFMCGTFENWTINLISKMSRFNIDFVILIKRNLYVDYIRNLRKKMEINKKLKWSNYIPFMSQPSMLLHIQY